MSFSSEVKEEMAGRPENARHCRIASLAAMLHICGQIGGGSAGIRTENGFAARSFEANLGKFVDCEICTEGPGEGKNGIYSVTIREAASIERLLEAVRMEKAAETGSFAGLPIDRTLLKKTCCRKAFLRASFLLSGSVSNPEKSYHLEIAFQNKEDAELLEGIMNSLGLEAKTVIRTRSKKQQPVVYLKEGEQISDCLGMMGAYQSVMKLENARILRDIAGSVNRRVNCETANLMKTVDASVRQCEDIRFLQQEGVLKGLPEGLKQVAELRLSMPDASLKELSENLDPPLGKSGVNHRLMRLSEMAERLRKERSTE